MNPLNKRIGAILKDHREIKHLTQLDLSKRLGYQSTQFISLFERGLSKCPTKVLGKLCKILDIDPYYFYELYVIEFKASLKKDLGLR